MSLERKLIKIPNTLTFRLTFWYALTFIGFIAIAILVFYMSLKGILDQRMEDDLREDIAEFQTLYQKQGLEKLINEIEREVKSGEEGKLFIRLLDDNGKQIYASDLNHWQPFPTNQPDIKRVLTEKNPIFGSFIRDGHTFDTKVIFGILAPNMILNIGESEEETAEILALLPTAFIIMLFVVIPIASFVGWYIARHAVLGINEVSRTAAEIEKNLLDKRVSVKAQGREIQHLVDTFNAMLDRIWRLISEMKEMTDNIAHDLRSPLARIRAISELTISNRDTPENYKTAAADTIEECDRVLQMINLTLDVAEAEVGTLHSTRQALNISNLAQDGCELFEAVAEQKHIELTCDIDSNYVIHGDIQYLQRMLANLVDNALKYTFANGQVNIGLTSSKQNIEISVSDTGIGISDSEQERIFNRFYRCDQSRSSDGCGLGLSFSRAVARAHGGDIQVSSSIGIGSTFTIKLPIENSSYI